MKKPNKNAKNTVIHKEVNLLMLGSLYLHF